MIKSKVTKDVVYVGIASVLIGIVIGVSIALLFQMIAPSPQSLDNIISEKEAGELGKSTFLKVMYEYFKSMGMEMDSSALSVEVTNVKKRNDGIYEVYLSVNGVEYKDPLYITPDGKSAFFQRVDTVAEFELPTPNIPKKEKPEVGIYVMSFCPYGNQMEEALYEVIDLFKDIVNFTPYYIIYKDGDTYWALHGENELKENIIEKIIYNMYGIKTWSDFVMKVNKRCKLEEVDSCWKEIAKEMNLNITKIENELSAKFDEMVKSEYNATAGKGISASPTLLINGYTYKGPRAPNAIKEVLCKAFISPPEECNIEIKNETVTSPPAGSCG